MGHSRGDFHLLPVKLVAPPIQGLELSVTGVQRIPDCLLALEALLEVGDLSLGRLEIKPCQEEFNLPRGSDTPTRKCWPALRTARMPRC